MMLESTIVHLAPCLVDPAGKARLCFVLFYPALPSAFLLDISWSTRAFSMRRARPLRARGSLAMGARILSSFGGGIEHQSRKGAAAAKCHSCACRALHSAWPCEPAGQVRPGLSHGAPGRLTARASCLPTAASCTRLAVLSARRGARSLSSSRSGCKCTTREWVEEGSCAGPLRGNLAQHDAGWLQRGCVDMRWTLQVDVASSCPFRALRHV